MELPQFLNDIIYFIDHSMPHQMAVACVFLIGWLIAVIARKIVHRLMMKTDWDERLLGNTIMDTNKFIANLVYYLVMLILLLIVLEMLQASYVLDPLKDMLHGMLGFIPSILLAGAILFIGYIIAKVISNLVKVAGSVIDRLADKIGFKDSDKLVTFIQQIVFFLIFIPFLIQALNALELNAITNPANNILHKMMDAIPNLIGAVVVITLFAVGGKFLTTFLNNLLVNLGTDSLSEKLHLFIIKKDQSLSKVIANVIFFFLVFFGVVTGVEMLGFARLSEVLHNILDLSGDILFGMIVIVIGNFIAASVYETMNKSEENKFAAGVSRIAILGLFLAIALRTMGIANSIVELAFGLTLGSLAVTVALAYGLGGREAAGKHMEKILKRFQKD